MAGVRIELDAREATAALGQIVRRARNPRPAFDQIGSYLVSSVIRRFKTEAGPGGRPWKKSRRALEQGGQTLTDRGRLRASITHNVLSDGVEVGTNVVYAAIHQFGGKTKPRTIRPKRAKALRIPGIGFRASVRHPGSRIPARPFLGLDERDERAISRIVDRYLLEGR